VRVRGAAMRHNPPMGGVRGVFLRWTPEDGVCAADYTITRLTGFGVPLRSSNRVARARDLVRRSNQLTIWNEDSMSRR